MNWRSNFPAANARNASTAAEGKSGIGVGWLDAVVVGGIAVALGSGLAPAEAIDADLGGVAVGLPPPEQATAARARHKATVLATAAARLHDSIRDSMEEVITR